MLFQTSQTPASLISILLLLSTDEGDLALVPFPNLGTTAVATQQRGRLHLGGEREGKHARMAMKRPTGRVGRKSSLGGSHFVFSAPEQPKEPGNGRRVNKVASEALP